MVQFCLLKNKSKKKIEEEEEEEEASIRLYTALTWQGGSFTMAYVRLRYGWEPSNLPSSCSCGQRFGLEHALTCRRGGYVAMRHDEVRDLFSELLAETCSNVTREPELQPLDGVSLQTRCKPPRRCPAGHQSGRFLGEKSFWGHIFWCTGL